jgi:ATP-dependent 26S proteasome regulatory subunit
MGSEGLRIEVLSREPADGEQFIADLRTSMRELSVYRGKVLDLVGGEHPMMGQGASVVFRTVPTVQREEIVLPDGVLENVELHTVEFARHSDALRARGRHVRRGLLLHGPPGTGKTLTASYLIRRLEGRTVVILSGGGLGLIRDACALARDLSPGLVVLEDVDLVAQERTMHFGTSLLFDLLNEIDGIGEDEDVIFLMTTNRADLLEPALAARPGRVDQAVELPLPDAAGRDRLLELFSRGLTLDLSDRASLVEATEGTSPAFLRELVRKAALFAATREQDQVDDSHFASALALLEQGGGVTKKILGAGGDAGSPGRPDDADWYE